MTTHHRNIHDKIPKKYTKNHIILQRNKKTINKNYLQEHKLNLTKELNTFQFLRVTVLQQAHLHINDSYMRVIL